MSLPPTYSRRKRQAKAQSSDVYEYGPFPERLRNQISQILKAAIGEYNTNSYSDQSQNQVWEHIKSQMCRELGVENLSNHYHVSDYPDDDLLDWMRSVDEIDDYLDALEMALKIIDVHIRMHEYQFSRITRQSPDDAIAEINARILEAGFGFQFVNGEFVQVDSLLAHKEIVVPAILLTNDPKFTAANAEYMRAHEAFRRADYETSLTECAKAFESVLKVIASERSWSVQSSDSASKLIDAAVRANFLQSYMAAGFTSLRAMLESGVAAVRNKTAAHGAGISKRVVPKELAAFQLHQTASVIVFLIESHAAQPI